MLTRGCRVKKKVGSTHIGSGKQTAARACADTVSHRGNPYQEHNEELTILALS